MRDVHFGGNWTTVNLQDTLQDVTLEQATTKIHSFNTIATLVFHINYYIDAVLKVLQGAPLNAKDELSFNHPQFESETEWQAFLTKVWEEAETFAGLIEQLPDSKLEEYFTNEKYGNYFRNLHGIIEHTHYHLGQIVLLKKLLLDDRVG
ncbi:MAG TPA: DinB family protein [Flavipsychrobacter sp.]|nr:DinB family protein [Flavipsychrobacter sp.]